MGERKDQLIDGVVRAFVMDERGRLKLAIMIGNRIQDRLKEIDKSWPGAYATAFIDGMVWCNASLVHTTDDLWCLAEAIHSEIVSGNIDLPRRVLGVASAGKETPP